MNSSKFLFNPVFFFLIQILIGMIQIDLTHANSAIASKDHGHSNSPKEQKELWTCSMHPQVKRDKPGQCPICGMNLVKLEQEVDESAPSSQNLNKGPTRVHVSSPTGHASFKLSLKRQQMIGVKYGVVEKKELYKSIRVAGRLAFDPELYTAQNEYLEALRQLQRVKDSPISDVKHSAERMVQSAKLRLRVLGLSDKQISGLDASKSNEASLLIHKPGQDIWVYAEIYEMDLPFVRSGQMAEISAGFLGGKKLEGKIVSVDRVLNPTTRTAKARILLLDIKASLRPESYVDVFIQAPLGEQVTVPFDAVLDTGQESWVFVTDGKGTFEPRLVTIKLQADENIAIGSGLQPGEKIVTSANFLIDSESRLKGSMSTEQETNEGATKSKSASCPKGQHWDGPMAMCMPDVGGQ